MGNLDELISGFNRQYKEQIAFNGLQRIKERKIPFSSARVNYMLYGGIPRGRIIEFCGEEGSGKTTSALDIVSNSQMLFEQEYQEELQRLESSAKPTKSQETALLSLKSKGPKRVVYIDTENTLDEDWARTLSVDVDNLIILRPQSQTAEQIFQMALDMMETGEVGLMILDSLAVMVSQQAYEKTMEEKTYCGISQPLTTFCNKAIPLCTKYSCTIICINQVREDMNNQYNKYVTPGGKAFKHACSVRLMFQKGEYIDENGDGLKRSAESPAGNLVNISAMKIKSCKPDRKLGFYTLNYTHGVDKAADLIDLAAKYGHIARTGAWFSIIDPDTGEILIDQMDGSDMKFQGKKNLLTFVKENEDIYDMLLGKVSPHIEED